ncbi:MAG: YfiR family protein [Rhodospirillaceae bacterium]|nr:MAG: YfiR family protein [Rhodospirillaceae bacterium]
MRLRLTRRQFECTVTSALIFLLAVFAPHIVFAFEGETLEYAVKAAYLYKLGGFVEWPASAFASSNSPITLCVVGEDPFDGILDKAVEGQHIGDHPIAVRRLKSVTHESGCQILYVGAADPRQVAQVLDVVHGSSVLTVTDTPEDSETGGVVHFVIKDNRVRFDINDQAAAENGLVISSKLLSLAMSVKPRA